jgi:hypothetical protein
MVNDLEQEAIGRQQTGKEAKTPFLATFWQPF